MVGILNPVQVYSPQSSLCYLETPNECTLSNLDTKQLLQDFNSNCAFQSTCNLTFSDYIINND